jgi:predicted Abi (CAAX) family protease
MRDVRDALLTAPSAAAWRRCALIFLGFLVVALPIGLASGFLDPSAPVVTGQAIGLAGLSIALSPAFTEELLFRVLLLPRRADAVSRAKLAAMVCGAAMVYVAAHPLAAMLTRPSLLPVFANPFYLALVALLGLACSGAYLVSGSIWPAVVIHWTTVMLWLFALGGQRLLQT